MQDGGWNAFQMSFLFSKIVYLLYLKYFPTVPHHLVDIHEGFNSRSSFSNIRYIFFSLENAKEGHNFPKSNGTFQIWKVFLLNISETHHLKLNFVISQFCNSFCCISCIYIVSNSSSYSNVANTPESIYSSVDAVKSLHKICVVGGPFPEEQWTIQFDLRHYC